MPILPLIDLLILLSWTTLIAGGLLKAVNLVFSEHFELLGLTSMDLLTMALAMLVFALALIGRTWVKLHEPGVLAGQRRNQTLEAYERMQRQEPSEDGQAPVAGEHRSGGTAHG